MCNNIVKAKARLESKLLKVVKDNKGIYRPISSKRKLWLFYLMWQST